MISTATGRKAEQRVANYLERQGWEIIDHNWRTRRCEIDVIAKHNNHVYFIEVKYRSSIDQGAGLDYVTPAKIRQMNYASRLWLARNSYVYGYDLLAIEVDVTGIITMATIQF